MSQYEDMSGPNSHHFGPDKLREGYKHDEDKVRIDLVPMDVFLELAKLFTMGAKKYEDNNWKKGLRYGQVYAALMRHLIAFMQGEIHDPDNGQHHLDSVIWNAWVLRYMELHREHYKQFDDRPNTGPVKYTITIENNVPMTVAVPSAKLAELIPDGWYYVTDGPLTLGHKIWDLQLDGWRWPDSEMIGKQVSDFIAVIGVKE